MMCDKDEWADVSGYELINGSVEETIHNILTQCDSTVASIEKHKDDEDDYNQPYKSWYVRQEGASDALSFRLYSDNSWVGIWG